MAASYQIPSTFSIVDDEVDSKRSIAKHTSPRFVDAILHSSSNRLRFRVDSRLEDIDNFQRYLVALPHVKTARFNGWARCFVVIFNDGQTIDSSTWLKSLPEDIVNIPSVPELAKQVSASAELEDDDEKFVPTRIILPVCSLGLALLAGPLALPPLAIGFFIIGSAHLSFRRAWDGLKKDRMINVDFLDSLAVLLHSLEGFLLGPAMMITMVEGGEAVRDATQRIAHSSNTDLVASLQSDVRLITDQGEVIVSSFELSAGDRVSFLPGDKVPIDGVIESGVASLDVVKLTGESVPRMSRPGDEILAGFIVLEGSIVVKTSAVGDATRVGQITKMIEEAPVFDTRVGNFASNIANKFVLPTLALAGLSLFISGGSIAQAASLLMFDLGSGLRVSVPTAIMAALSRASSQGLLIRSGRALEQLVDVDVVIFDKTGTLTEGHPSIVHFDAFEPSGQQIQQIDDSLYRELLQISTSLEQGLNHPIAKAIRDSAESVQISASDCDSWDYKVGRGVIAEIYGKRVLLGNFKLLEDEGVVLPVFTARPDLSVATPIYLAIDGSLACIHYALDQIRPDTCDMIAELHRRGIEAHMLTGDIATVAHSVAESIGLQPHEVHADALPDQKAELVKYYTSQGKKVAFVGDGINDSAALAYADVSVSFASGSDLARETADIVLTNDKVSDLIVAQDLARHTFALVKQNIGIVGVPNLSALVIGTFLPVSPIAAVFLNNGSALVAAGNAIRALGFKAKPLPSSSLSSSDTNFDSSDQVSTRLSSEPLSISALAKRLGVTHQKISAQRRRNDFSTWIAQHDPDGWVWEYSLELKTFSIAPA